MNSYTFCAAPHGAGPTASGASPAPRYQLAVLGNELHAVTIALEAAARGLSVLLIGEHPITHNTTNLFAPLNFSLEKLEALAFSDVARNIKEEARLAAFAPHAVHTTRYYGLSAPQARSDKRAQWGLNLYNRLSKLQCTSPEPLEPNAPLTTPSVLGEVLTPSLNPLRLSLYALNRFYELGGHAIFGAQTRARANARDWELSTGQYSTQCEAVVNATGEKAVETSQLTFGVQTRCALTTFPTHTWVTQKLYPGNHGYILQGPNKALVYVTPINKQFSAIGPIIGEREAIEPWLMESYNRTFSETLTPANIIEVRAGTAYAHADPTQNTPCFRPNVLLDSHPHRALINVFGHDHSKALITAERAMDLLKDRFQQPPHNHKPHHHQPQAGFTALTHEVQNAYSELAPNLVRQLCAHYGTDIHTVLNHCSANNLPPTLEAIFEAELAFIFASTGIGHAPDALRLHSSINTQSAAEVTAVQCWLDQAHRHLHAPPKSA